MKNYLLIIPILLIMILSVFSFGSKEKIKTGIPYYTGADFDPQQNLLDIYMPDSKEKTPVLIFIHGGIWRAGDKGMEPMTNLGKIFAGKGITVVQLNYRLFPKVTFPEFPRDIAKAVAWVYNNIESYNGDKNKIFIGGHSAGGHLSALVGLDSSYLNAERISPDIIKGLIPLEGAYDINLMFKDPETAGIWMLSDAFGSDENVWKQASPVNYVQNCNTRILLIHGSNDNLTPREQTDMFYKKLQDNNKNAEVYTAQGKDHFSVISKMNMNDDVVEKIVKFIKE